MIFLCTENISAFSRFILLPTILRWCISFLCTFVVLTTFCVDLYSGVVLFSIVITSLGEVRAFPAFAYFAYVLIFVHFLFLLVSGIGCGL